MAKKLEEIKEEECPYELPEGWKWERLGNIANIKRGASPRPIKDYITDDVEGVNWIKIGDTVVNSKYIDTCAEKITTQGAKKSVYVDIGTLLLSNSMSFGRPYILKIDGCIHDGWLAITPSVSIDKEYLFYGLIEAEWYFSQVAVGTAVRNLNSARVSNTPVPLPPKETQQKIVDIIESLFAKLDVAQEKVEQVLAESEKRRPAILHNAFSGKLTEKWRKENNVSLDSWKEYLLKEICDKITEGTHKSPVNTEYGEYMYVTAKNIKESGIDLSKITYVTKEIHNEIYSRCDVLKGDVLYIKDGATTGIATINTLEEPFSMLSSVALLRLNYEILLSEYLAYLLNSSEQKARMINNMSGNAITRLTLTKIKSTKIIVSSIQEQKEIVHRLDKFLSVEDKVKSTCQNTLEIIATMRKSILAKAFRGELIS